MNDRYSLEDRVIELESRAADQEDTLNQISSRIAEQDNEIAKLHILVQHLHKSLKTARDGSEADLALDNQVPPHY